MQLSLNAEKSISQRAALIAAHRVREICHNGVYCQLQIAKTHIYLQYGARINKKVSPD